MKVLLDTQILVWAAAAPERLGQTLGTLEDADLRLVSAASTWELAIKQGLGKIDLGTDVRAWVSRVALELSAEHLDISSDHAAAVEHLPSVHRDPFDRLLVAQALHEGALLITADRMLSGYGDAVRLVRD